MQIKYLIHRSTWIRRMVYHVFNTCHRVSVCGVTESFKSSQHVIVKLQKQIL